MMNFFRRKLNKKGFTLIELIVVIAILGILAAIAIPRLGGFREQAALSADRTSAAVIAKAAEMYAAGQNLAEADKDSIDGTPVAAGHVLITDGLLTEDDIEAQAPGESFDLEYDTTDGLYRVSYSSSGDELYPDAH